MGEQFTGAETRRPLIGVMPKYVVSDRIPATVSAFDSLIMADNYLRAVIIAGGVPVVLPITPEKGVYETLLPQLDGVLLTGGADLNPERYGGNASHEKLGFVVPLREKVEYQILDYAVAHDLPLLGICRGIQLLNIYFGGTLYEDLPEQFATADECGNPIVHWQGVEYDKPSHVVKLVDGSHLQSILQVSEIATNSMHHQGVRELAPALDAMAYGPGGLVESVEVRGKSFMIGLQWHPEFLAPTTEKMEDIFRAFVDAAAVYQEKKAC